MKRKWKREVENRKRERWRRRERKSRKLWIWTWKSSNTDCDQDSDISFMKDADEEIDSKHSRRRRMGWKHEEKHTWSHERMKQQNNPMLDQNTQKNDMEISDENGVMKAAGWNPELSTKYKTHRAVGRPKKRWKMKSMTSSDPKQPKMRQAMLKDTIMNGSKQRKIKSVGRKLKTSSQRKQQQLPAQDTSLEGERLNVHDTWRGHDSVGTDVRQWMLLARSLARLTVHIIMLGCEHSLMLMKHRNIDPELRQRFQGDLEMLDIQDRARSCSRKTKVPVKDRLRRTRAFLIFPSFCLRLTVCSITGIWGFHSSDRTFSSHSVAFVWAFLIHVPVHASTVSQLRTLSRMHGTTVITDFFSRGYDPFTERRARPLTDVGWPFLCVIVIAPKHWYWRWCACTWMISHVRPTRDQMLTLSGNEGPDPTRR